MDQQVSKRNRAPVRIMLVDDHPNTAATLARAITRIRTDVEIICATSGVEALELAGSTSVDILITDMMMPGMNGIELIRHLQAQPAGKPVHTILMTAYDVPGLRETAHRLHVHDILIKPVATERICQIVARVLDTLVPPD